jgi:hypothetical protein
MSGKLAGGVRVSRQATILLKYHVGTNTVFAFPAEVLDLVELLQVLDLVELLQVLDLVELLQVLDAAADLVELTQ